tara:strand:+ start:249 stop:470 length:222 start_codon:yes stop_codon:yes gene_type:complete
MKNQHQIAQILDRCAERANFIDREPATQKQCWYLAKLMLDAGDDGSELLLDTSAILTKQDASQRIEVLLGGAA